MDAIERSEFEKLDGLNRWEHVERLRRERDYFRALAQAWGDEKDRLTATNRGAEEAVEMALAVLEDADHAVPEQLRDAIVTAITVLALSSGQWNVLACEGADGCELARLALKQQYVLRILHCE
jgi:hypothetical protein